MQVFEGNKPAKGLLPIEATSGDPKGGKRRNHKKNRAAIANGYASPLNLNAL
jgi:hypothetical protein